MLVGLLTHPVGNIIQVCVCVSVLIVVADGGEDVDWEKTSLKPYMD